MSSLSRGTKAEIFSILPAGTVLPFAGATAPDGWAICNGTAISRTDYPELFLAIGETWGNGDGSTTFNLPDLEGRFLRGADNSSGIDPDAGSRVPLGNGNAEGVGSLQNDATAKNGLTASQAGHRHIGGFPRASGLDYATSRYGVNNSGTGVRVSSRSPSSYGLSYPYTETVTPSITVSDGDLESRPQNCSVNYIIKL